MQITTKGQVTIPQEIREEFGFLPHAEVKFVVENGKVFLVKDVESNKRGKKLIEKMRGKATVDMTTDEIMALTRKKIDSRCENL